MGSKPPAADNVMRSRTTAASEVRNRGREAGVGVSTSLARGPEDLGTSVCLPWPGALAIFTTIAQGLAHRASATQTAAMRTGSRAPTIGRDGQVSPRDRVWRSLGRPDSCRAGQHRCD
ncbi:hypothetical protein VTH06DRAFT_2694 [Thermothelomyces fergusii]